MPLPKRVLEKAKDSLKDNNPMSRWEITQDLERTDMVLGVDPGLLGGFAFYDCGTCRFISVQSTPTLKGTNGKRVYDISKLVEIIERAVCRTFFAMRFTFCIERQQPIAYQGLVSTFTTGYGYGLWTGILHSLQTKNPQYVVVRAEDWQHILWKEHAEKDDTKSKSIARVHRLFPSVNLTSGGRSKKDLDGRADACNIAHYAFLRMVSI